MHFCFYLKINLGPPDQEVVKNLLKSCQIFLKDCSSARKTSSRTSFAALINSITDSFIGVNINSAGGDSYAIMSTSSAKVKNVPFQEEEMEETITLSTSEVQGIQVLEKALRGALTLNAGVGLL